MESVDRKERIGRGKVETDVSVSLRCHPSQEQRKQLCSHQATGSLNEGIANSALKGMPVLWCYGGTSSQGALSELPLCRRPWNIRTAGKAGPGKYQHETTRNTPVRYTNDARILTLYLGLTNIEIAFDGVRLELVPLAPVCFHVSTPPQHLTQPLVKAHKYHQRHPQTNPKLDLTCKRSSCKKST